jgi:hypothetical protein
MSVEPLPPCGELDPEERAGEPVDDGFDEEWSCRACGYRNAGGICTHCGRVREVTDDGSVDPGAVPGQPQA